MRNTYVVLAAALLTLGLLGCGENGQGQQGTGSADTREGPVYAANIDDGARPYNPAQNNCPVTGKGINPEFHVDRTNGRIYFHNKEAVDEFKTNPGRYISRVEQAGSR